MYWDVNFIVKSRILFRMSKGTGQESGVNKFVKCMTGLMAGMMQTLCRSATLDESRGLSLWTHDFSSQCRPFPYK